MKKLSIIIPIYNVEHYVEKCIRSCANQLNVSPVNYEIILINDGTKDKSLEIAKRVSLDYDNIIIHSQKNGGLSSARNKGLSLAKGEYVWFVDSDDWITEDALSIIFKEIEDNNLDILEFDHYYAIEKNNVIRLKINEFYNNIETDVISGIQSLEQFGFIVGVCYKVIRRSLFQNNLLSFPLNEYNEDFIITYSLVSKSIRYKKISIPLYYYYSRYDSITKTRNSEHLQIYYEDILKNLKVFQKLIAESSFNTTKIKEMQFFYATNLLLGILKLKNNQLIEYFINELADIELYPIIKYDYHNIGWKRNLFIKLINNKMLFKLFLFIKRII